MFHHPTPDSQKSPSSPSSQQSPPSTRPSQPSPPSPLSPLLLSSLLSSQPTTEFKLSKVLKSPSTAQPLLYPPQKDPSISSPQPLSRELLARQPFPLASLPPLHLRDKHSRPWLPEADPLKPVLELLLDSSPVVLRESSRLRAVLLSDLLGLLLGDCCYFKVSLLGVIDLEF